MIALTVTSFLSHTLFIRGTSVFNMFFAQDIAHYFASLANDVQIAFGKKTPVVPPELANVDPDIIAAHSGAQPNAANRPKVLETMVYAAEQQELQMNSIPADKKKDVYLEQGFAYQAAGLKDKAEEKYNAAIEKDPQDALSYVRLASVYAEKQDIDRAIKMYEKALSVQPDNQAAALALAQTYQYKKNQPEKAIQIYLQQIIKKPSDPYMKLFLVDAYVDGGRITEAKNVLIQIISSDPSNQTARNRLDSIR